MAKATQVWEARDITIGRLLGAVTANTERGARIKAAREFNLPYNHVSASLPTENPSDDARRTVRAANPDASHRTHGSTGIILDSAKIQSYLDAHAGGAKVYGELLYLTHLAVRANGRSAVIGTEGVGTYVEMNSDYIPVYVLFGFQWDEVAIPKDVIFGAFTDERADVADFVRTFGSRLDVNAYIWSSFVKNGGK